MAICKMCHKMIPDGRDFCDECESKSMNQADESYLDRLLSSVSSRDDNQPTGVDILSGYRREEPVARKSDTVVPDFALNNSDPQTEDDVVSDIMSELTSNEGADYIDPFAESPVEELPVEDVFADAPAEEIPVEDVFAEEPAEEIPVEDVFAEEPAEEIPVENVFADAPAEEIPVEDVFTEEPAEEIPVEDVFTEEPAEEIPVEDVFTEEPAEEIPVEDVFAEIPVEEVTEEVSEELPVEETLTEVPGEEAGADIPMEEDIMAGLEGDLTDITMDDGTTDVPAEEAGADVVPTEELMEDITASDAVGGETELSKDEEIDSMINDLLSEMPEEPVDLEPQLDSADIADIFSAQEDESPIETFVNPGEDVEEKGLLGADELFALDDATIPEGDFVDIGGSDEPELDNIDIMAEIESGDLEQKIKSLDAPTQKSKKPEKKKKSWFQRLFGNVVEELTDEEREARRVKAEEEEQKKAEALELKKKKAEESKAEKAAQKELDKAENAEKKKQADEAKRKAKEEAREKAKKKKEAREALEISEEDEGRINKAGASILFILFAVITLFIILGTKSYSYNLSIENARDDFEIRHYNEAYYDVYGLDIKDEDIELYDRIMTVMYVNAQLNSYHYYMTSNNEDKALDSLVKGLAKYEKYFALASKLQIEDDLIYVKGNILNELNSKFGISEEEAYSMIDIDDVVDYSEYIYALLGTYDLETNQ